MCRATQDQAQALLDRHASCSRDEDCAIEWARGSSCLPVFTCPRAIRASDLKAFRSELAELSERATESCEGCTLAKCVGPEQLTAWCDPATSLCSAHYEPGASSQQEPGGDGDGGLGSRDAAAANEQDAARADSSVDASRVTADAGLAAKDAGAVVDPYACEQSSDCTVKDVGNCCGYYPRCANVNARFTRPVCNGQAGVCGFPVIESCACEQKRCVSLQANAAI